MRIPVPGKNWMTCRKNNEPNPAVLDFYWVSSNFRLTFNLMIIINQLNYSI
jgi:hypothetical protein